MAEIRTIARPYARAMFMAGQDNADSLLRLLAILSQAVVVFQMDQAIKNPSILREDIINVLIGICEDVDIASLNLFGKGELVRWLRLLSRAKRLACLPQIAELFADEHAKQRCAVDVVITSALPLNELQKSAVIAKLSKKWGKTIQATYQSDPTLMGGIKIQAGDWVQDHSIADKLLRLSEDIQSWQ